MYRDNNNDYFALIVGGLLLLAMLIITPVACTSGDSARAALDSAGYSDITLGDYAWFECSDSDTFATRFTATNPAGKRTTGVVCCGLAKACTVRH